MMWKSQQFWMWNNQSLFSIIVPPPPLFHRSNAPILKTLPCSCLVGVFDSRSNAFLPIMSNSTTHYVASVLWGRNLWYFLIKLALEFYFYITLHGIFDIIQILWAGFKIEYFPHTNFLQATIKEIKK